MDLDQTNALIGAALGLLALLGAFVGWLRWVRPQWRGSMRTWIAVRDSLVGRDAQTESTTGRIIAPALPGIGVRLENVERSIESIAALLRSQHTQDQRLDSLEHRVAQLEDGTIERIAAKAESVAAWRAVEKIADTGNLPDVEGDADEIAELDG